VEGLLERRGEVEEIERYVARAAAGQGCVVVVEGPAGIGKSRLVAEARRRAEGAMLELSARRSGHEIEFAFGVVRQE
jgi:predicted ATPase